MKLKAELGNVFDSSGVSLERQFRGFDTDGDGAIDHGTFPSLFLGAHGGTCFARILGSLFGGMWRR